MSNALGHNGSANPRYGRRFINGDTRVVGDSPFDSQLSCIVFFWEKAAYRTSLAWTLQSELLLHRRILVPVLGVVDDTTELDTREVSLMHFYALVRGV